MYIYIQVIDQYMGHFHGYVDLRWFSGCLGVYFIRCVSHCMYVMFAMVPQELLSNGPQCK